MIVGDIIKNLANVPEGADVQIYISRDGVMSVRAEWLEKAIGSIGSMKRSRVATIVQGRIDHQVVVM